MAAVRKILSISARYSAAVRVRTVSMWATKAYTSVPDAPKGDGGVAYING